MSERTDHYPAIVANSFSSLHSSLGESVLFPNETDNPGLLIGHHGDCHL
jgi:hypothetical protein